MRRALVLVILALSTVACEQALDKEGIRDDTFVSDVRGCADLEAEIERLAIREMNAEIDEMLRGLEKRTSESRDAVMTVPAAAPAPAPSPNSAADFTTTNTQERDVDEPDFIKNDGARIFVIHGRQLVAVRAWPPENARVEATLDLGPSPAEMFFHKDRLIVFSRLNSWGEPRPAGAPEPASSILPFPGGTSSMAVDVYDVAGVTPVHLHRLQLDGRYVSARRTQEAIRFVSVAPRRGPELVYWPDRNIDWSRPGALRAALEEARRENVRRIKASTLEDWLPHVYENGKEVARDCGTFFATNVSARLGFTTVSTLDLGSLATSHRTVLNPADEVYASRDAIYLTARHYWTSPISSDNEVRQNHTYIFKFDVADGRSVRYAASGGVAGHIVDQFALDEENGYLRIATTRETNIGWRRQDRTNNVFVLRADDGKLRVVGEINGLARNELIYSARFEGARGYLVTFRQVDPLFTLDLANPGQPRVAGELKIPGFSTYLHPLDRDHLLAIGRDATDAGFFQAIQLQIFDVSDFGNPQVKHKLALGSRSSSSDALWDHKAFTYFPSRGLLAIPFSDYSPARARGFSSTLEVLRATASSGIAVLGSIEHGDLVQGTDARRYSGWRPTVRRGVMMDDFVYSISYGGLKVHDVRDLSRPVTTVVFP